MKKVYVSLSLLFILFFTSCAQNKKYQSVSVKEAKELIVGDTTLQILDVRTPQEVKQGKIEGAIVINWSSKSFKEGLEQLDKYKPVLVYCAGGVRSAKAADFMTEEGFLKVYDLKKGYSGWKK